MPIVSCLLELRYGRHDDHYHYFGIFFLHHHSPIQSFSHTNSHQTVILIFVIILPLLLEPMKLLPNLWDMIRSTLASIGLVSR
jgi:hypothetical protein